MSTVKPGNIWSGSKVPELAALTNPTELARRKGRIGHVYPIVFRNQTWPDVEDAYQWHKRFSPKFLTIGDRMKLLADVMEAKFRQYPELIEFITAQGGVAWIEQCSHFTRARTQEYGVWEGEGENSYFIRCLREVYRRCT